MNPNQKRLLLVIWFWLLAAILNGCGVQTEQIMASNQAAAVQVLRTIHQSEQGNYQVQKKYITLDELGRNNPEFHSLIMASLGYRHQVRPSQDGKTYEAFATPIEYGKTGRISYYATEKGIIHASDKGGREAGREDPELK